MADWVPAPENSPWLLPDDTRVRIIAEGVRRTVGGPHHPGTTRQTPMLQFDTVNASFEYWSDAAAHRLPEYWRGYDAAMERYRLEVAAGRQDRAALLLAGWCMLAALTALGHLGAAGGGVWWAAVHAALALTAGVLAVRAAVVARRIRKETPDAH